MSSHSNGIYQNQLKIAISGGADLDLPSDLPDMSSHSEESISTWSATYEFS